MYYLWYISEIRNFCEIISRIKFNNIIINNIINRSKFNNITNIYHII